MASRNSPQAKQACAELRKGAKAKVSFVRLDLSDLASAREAANDLRDTLGGEPLDVLVCNAGVWSQRYGTSPQGHGITFPLSTARRAVAAVIDQSVEQ